MSDTCPAGACRRSSARSTPLLPSTDAESFSRRLPPLERRLRAREAGRGGQGRGRRGRELPLPRPGGLRRLQGRRAARAAAQGGRGGCGRGRRQLEGSSGRRKAASPARGVVGQGLSGRERRRARGPVEAGGGGRRGGRLDADGGAGAGGIDASLSQEADARRGEACGGGAAQPGEAAQPGARRRVVPHSFPLCRHRSRPADCKRAPPPPHPSRRAGRAPHRPARGGGGGRGGGADGDGGAAQRRLGRAAEGVQSASPSYTPPSTEDGPTRTHTLRTSGSGADTRHCVAAESLGPDCWTHTAPPRELSCEP